MRRADSPLAPNEQPNPPAKRKEKDMTERKVEAKKRCSRCKKWKNKSEFHKHKLNSMGLTAWCKQCACEVSRKRYVKINGAVRTYLPYAERHRVVGGVRQKLCNKCDEWKDKSQYYKHRRHYDGLADVCKVCADKATNKCRRRRKAMAEEAEFEARRRKAIRALELLA